MKPKNYKVEFYVGVPGKGPFIFVTAMSATEARILAQAERIRDGLDYEVEHVWEISDKF